MLPRLDTVQSAITTVVPRGTCAKVQPVGGLSDHRDRVLLGDAFILAS